MCTFGKKTWLARPPVDDLPSETPYLQQISGHEYTKWDVCDLWQAIGTLVGLWF